jgi:hypothetical protein
VSEVETGHRTGEPESKDKPTEQKEYTSDVLLKGCGIEILLWLMFFPLIHFGLSGSWVSLAIAIVLGLLYFGLRWK